MQILRCSPRRKRLFAASSLAVIAALLAVASPLCAASPAHHSTSGIAAALAAAPASPNFGTNVYIFTPEMALSDIQATVNAIAAQQVSNQFGTQRYALLFQPGTYGSSSNPLNFQVGALNVRQPRRLSLHELSRRAVAT